MRKKSILIIGSAILILVTINSLTAQRTRRRVGTSGRSRGGFLTQAYPPLPVNEQEKHILGILDDMNRNQSSGMKNVPTIDGRILRLLAEAIDAKHVVEIGTSNGYSGMWFCLALRTTGGKLTTHEIDKGRASLARENFQRAGVDKFVTLVIGDAHQTVTRLKEPIDIVFLDADKDGYTDYLNKLLPLVSPGGLILAHNINSAPRAFVNAITTNPDLETLQLEGVTITLKKRQAE